MKSGEMKSVYELLLSVPGMGETVKLDLKLPRKNVLFICQLLGGSIEKGDSPLAEILGKETLDELRGIITDCLDKAGLTELERRMDFYSTTSKP